MSQTHRTLYTHMGFSILPPSKLPLPSSSLAILPCIWMSPLTTNSDFCLCLSDGLLLGLRPHRCCHPSSKDSPAGTPVKGGFVGGVILYTRSPAAISHTQSQDRAESEYSVQSVLWASASNLPIFLLPPKYLSSPNLLAWKQKPTRDF